MGRFIRKWFCLKTNSPKKAVRPVKPDHAPLIVSFDGRVVRLRLPEI